MKKIIVATVLGLFYAANIFYERGHTQELSMATIPQISLTTQTNTLSTGTQTTGSGDPPQTVQPTTNTAQAAKSAPAVQQQITQQTGQIQTANAKTVLAQAPSLSQTVAPAAAKPVVAAPPVTQSVPPPAPGHVYTQQQTTAAATTTTPPPAGQTQQGQYKNGTYTGTSVDALYGFVQVQVTVQGGQITNVTFLSYPNDNPTSLQKSTKATPILAQEAVTAQSANVQAVSGATETSKAFVTSLTSALTQAKV